MNYTITNLNDIMYKIRDLSPIVKLMGYDLTIKNYEDLGSLIKIVEKSASPVNCEFVKLIDIDKFNSNNQKLAGCKITIYRYIVNNSFLASVRFYNDVLKNAHEKYTVEMDIRGSVMHSNLEELEQMLQDLLCYL